MMRQILLLAPFFLPFFRIVIFGFAIYCAVSNDAAITADSFFSFLPTIYDRYHPCRPYLSQPYLSVSICFLCFCICKYMTKLQFFFAFCYVL